MENKHTKSKEKLYMHPQVSILDHLIASGYETQFKTTEQGLVSLKTQRIFKSSEIKEVNFYRSKGESDSYGSPVVCTIEANDGEKGTLIDSYCTHKDSQVNEFKQKEKESNKKF
jgi:hypothetical protein